MLGLFYDDYDKLTCLFHKVFVGNHFVGFVITINSQNGQVV